MSLASRETQRLIADRLADATRFATLAEPALRTGETDRPLRAELIRYDELYGIGAAVVDQDGGRCGRLPRPHLAAIPAVQRSRGGP